MTPGAHMTIVTTVTMPKIQRIPKITLTVTM